VKGKLLTYSCELQTCVIVDIIIRLRENDDG